MKLMRLGALGYTLISIYLWPSKVAAAIVNATIDDQYGDSVTHRLVDYYPTWYTESCRADGTCGLPAFDKSQAFHNTYTQRLYSAPNPGIGINMQFIGTAIYVFFIVANIPTFSTINTANFSVDGNAPVLFAAAIPALPTVTPQYNVLAFSRTNLSNTLHTLNISISDTRPINDWIYVIFDYAIYTYDDGVSSSQAPSTTVTGAPGRRTPVGAIVGGIVGGITLLALVISLLFCWHRRGGHGALQSVRENGGPKSLKTQFNDGAGSLAASASGMPYTQSLAVRSESPMTTVTVSGGEFNTNHQANMRNNYRALHSGEVVVSSPDSQQLPSSEKALPATSNSDGLGTSSNRRSASPLLPTPFNVPGTREEARHARQEDLDNQLTVVQHNVKQLEESSGGPGRSVSLRRRTSGEGEIVEEEMHMSVPDMQEVIRSMRQQIRVLREQQSA